MSSLSREARALLDEARHGDGPSSEQREALRRLVFGALAGGGTLLGGSGAVAGAAASKASGVALLSAKANTAALAVWFWTGVGGGLVVTAPVAAYRYVTTRTATSAPAKAVNPTVASAAGHPPAPERAPALGAELAASTASEDPTPVRAPAPSTTNRRDGDWPRALDSAGLSLGVELLGSAQRDLAAGRADVALSKLAEHERRFPRGALSAERLAAKVLALCALGHAEEARRAAAEFQRTAPDSPLAKRVRASCAGQPSTEQR